MANSTGKQAILGHAGRPATRWGLPAILCAALLAAAPVHAQQRSIVNTGFEDGPQLPAPGGFFIRADSSTNGWISTDGQIEIWSDGFRGIPASAGGYYAELNPTTPVGLYQEICLLNGEALGWTFDHRNRDDGARINPQTAVLEVVSLGGTSLQTLATQTSFAGTGWQRNSGVATYTGPTGIQRVQFRSTNPGSFGNLLDEIQITLAPLAELASASGADAEATGGNMIQLVVNGNVQTAFSVPFTITGGTATAGADFTVTSNSVTVPAGTYDGVSAASFFPLPISIVDDGFAEPDETLVIELSATPVGTARIASTSCTAPVTTVATYTITDDDAGPVATDDTIAIPVSGPASVDPLANDNGTGLDPASVVLTGAGAPPGSTLAAGGKTLTVPGEGVWSVNPTTGLVTFTPEPGFAGSATPAGYTVDDGGGNTSNVAFISAVIAAPPTIRAVADSFSIDDDATGGTTASVLGNDSLNGGPINNAALVTLTPGAAPTPPSGTIAMNGNGTITVAAGTTPGTYTYPYQICEVAAPANCSTNVATIVVGVASILDEIQDDLVRVLEDDRAATVSQIGNRMSGYASDAGQRLRERSGDACLVAVNEILDREKILFDTDRAVIKPQSARVLDEIATALGGCPGNAFEIAGHTDSDASESYNLALSQRRVNAVLRALAERNVETGPIVARGYGESRPIASNTTEAGKAQNRRVEFVPLGSDLDVAGCEEGQRIRALDAAADGAGASVEGQFLSDRHDCARDVREVYEGTLSYLETDAGQEQAMFNLSYRRERYVGANSVRGYFVGAYLTRNDIAGLAVGDIRGTGVNGGLYGAERFESGLFLDYYLGAAAGSHDFDLAFTAPSGTVVAAGDYTYLAAFAGIALSGDLEFGERTVTPRAGIDYMYAPESDVTVAALSGAPVNATLELDALSGGRVFAEIGTIWDLNGGEAQFGVTPRIACYESIDGLDGACGFGGSIELSSAGDETGLIYSMELDAEFGDAYSRGSLSGSIERSLRLGTVSATMRLGGAGDVSVGGAYVLRF